MRPKYILALLFVVLGVTSGLSILGLQFLALAGEFRDRSAMHLGEVHIAMDLINGTDQADGDVTAQTADHIQRAQGHARWCLAGIAKFERMGMAWPSLSDARGICERNYAQAGVAVDLLDGHSALREHATFDTRDPILRQVDDIAHDLRHDFLAMRPLILEFRDRAMVFFTWSAVATILCLIVLAVFVSRQMVLSRRDQATQKKTLHQITQRFATAMKASEDGFAIFDPDRKLLECNERYRLLSHVDPEAVRPGMSIEEIFASAHAAGHYAEVPSKPLEFLDKFRYAPNRDNKSAEGIFALSGDRYVLSRFNTTEDGDLVVARTDITDLVRAERNHREQAEALQQAKDRIEQQSYSDPLTDLPNRRKLDEVLAYRLPRSQVVLICLDLDRFKQVNDILGHEAGDFVLCHVAEILRQAARPDDLMARVGGDEFVILCAPGTTLRDAMSLTETILDEVVKPLHFGNKRCLYGASFGIADAAPGEMQPSELLSAADAALYRAKAAGRGTAEIFTSEMRRETMRERALADRFAKALAEGEIVPYFQTQHAAADGAFVGAEVLARWEHPTEGVLVPDRFFAISRQLGMEADLDRAIFDAAVAAVDTLAAKGIDVPRVALNVSAARIMDPDFLIAARARVPTGRDRYVFEIQEAISHVDAGPGFAFAIDAIKELGFRIDVDDFGSGHASINGVLNIEPESLKIDRCITRHLGESERAARMIRSIIELANALDVKVIAEGVDTEDKARLLRDMGCDLLQGYLFSRPLTLSAFEATLSRLPARTSLSRAG